MTASATRTRIRVEPEHSALPAFSDKRWTFCERSQIQVTFRPSVVKFLPFVDCW